jgi:polyferredoxin
MMVGVPGSRADILRLPLLAGLVRWRHARTAVQLPVLLVAALVVYDGFFGPQLAPKNLAGVLPWLQWRGLIVLALLLVGNVFCFACPFMFTRRLARRLLRRQRPWPKALRNKWLAATLLATFFWSYEAFDLWASPLLTAALASAYFLVAFAVDGVFAGASFCKYVCPIGQFHFVNSLASPAEVRTRDLNVCRACRTKDCLKGRQVANGWQSGCQSALFQERKVGNMDCTFCLDCLQACPHDNVTIAWRVPTSELWSDPLRAGVGRLGQRTDLAALAMVLVFASFLNAFGMVAPVYACEAWLASLLGTQSEAVVLLVIFGLGLAVLPAALLLSVAAISRAISGARESIVALARRFSYCLVPLGFGMWLAHYSYHFLTGALTIVPVAQSFAADLGLPWLGAPRWELGPLVPSSWLLGIELLFLEFGLLGAIVTAYHLADAKLADRPRARWAFVPWAMLATALFACGAWLMWQPMEMRGTFLKG